MIQRDEFKRATAVSMVCRALHQLDIPASVNARYDIVINQKKISGSAYKVNGKWSYHHGTMLIDADIKQMALLTNPVKVVYIEVI
jgi:lipoate-protein ligase A